MRQQPKGGKGAKSGKPGKGAGKDAKGATFGPLKGGKAGQDKGAAPDMGPPMDGKGYAERTVIPMPKHMQRMLAPRLLASQWPANSIRTELTLDGRGGVARVSKRELRAVMQRVGQTLKPTAVLTSQPGYMLGLRGYRSERVFPTIVRRLEDGSGSRLSRHLMACGSRRLATAAAPCRWNSTMTS